VEASFSRDNFYSHEPYFFFPFFFFFNSIYTSVSLPVALRGAVESFVFLYLGLLLPFVFVLDSSWSWRLPCRKTPAAGSPGRLLCCVSALQSFNILDVRCRHPVRSQPYSCKLGKFHFFIRIRERSLFIKETGVLNAPPDSTKPPSRDPLSLSNPPLSSHFSCRDDTHSRSHSRLFPAVGRPEVVCALAGSQLPQRYRSGSGEKGHPAS
jgi:hypothetical protein